MVIPVLLAGWLVATQAVQCAGLIALIGALGYAVLVNWVQRSPTFTRITETVAAIASMYQTNLVRRGGERSSVVRVFVFKSE